MSQKKKPDPYDIPKQLCKTTDRLRVIFIRDDRYSFASWLKVKSLMFPLKQ